MTWEGGKDYIKNKGWGNVIGISKVHYIPNGVELLEFDHNAIKYQSHDSDLHNKECFKVIG